MLAVFHNLVEDNIVMRDLQDFLIVDRGAMTLPVIQHKQPSSAFMTRDMFQLISDNFNFFKSWSRNSFSKN